MPQKQTTEQFHLGQLNQARKNAPGDFDEQNINSPAAPNDEITGAEFFLIFCVGIINDAIDYLEILLGVASAGILLPLLAVIIKVVDIATSMILGLWCVFRLKKFPSARFGISFIVELIPGLGDFSPTWSIFIATIYLEQKHGINFNKLIPSQSLSTAVKK